jgi:hypothetical protein
MKGDSRDLIGKVFDVCGRSADNATKVPECIQAPS